MVPSEGGSETGIPTSEPMEIFPAPRSNWIIWEIYVYLLVPRDVFRADLKIESQTIHSSCVLAENKWRTFDAIQQHRHLICFVWHNCCSMAFFDVIFVSTFIVNCRIFRNSELLPSAHKPELQPLIWLSTVPSDVAKKFRPQHITVLYVHMYWCPPAKPWFYFCNYLYKRGWNRDE